MATELKINEFYKWNYFNKYLCYILYITKGSHVLINDDEPVFLILDVREQFIDKKSTGRLNIKVLWRDKIGWIYSIREEEIKNFVILE